MLRKEERKTLYGSAYVERFQKGHSSMRLDRLVKYIKLNSDSIVADFGCGNGMMMPLIAHKVDRYIGVDFSEPFIQAALANQKRLNINNAEYVCDEIQHFCDARQGGFHIALAMDLSEHVYDDEWLECLKSIRKSLKGHGKLYLHTPNAEFFVEIMKANNVIVKQFPEHIAVRDPFHNIKLLKEAGYSKIHLRFLAHYNLLKVVHIFSFLPGVGKYFRARIFIVASSGKS